MVFASASAAVAVTVGVVAVYRAGVALALGMHDDATVTAAVEPPAESVVSAVQSPLCPASVEVQVSAAAAAVSEMVVVLAALLG